METEIEAQTAVPDSVSVLEKETEVGDAGEEEMDDLFGDEEQEDGEEDIGTASGVNMGIDEDEDEDEEVEAEAEEGEAEGEEAEEEELKHADLTVDRHPRGNGTRFRDPADAYGDGYDDDIDIGEGDEYDDDDDDDVDDAGGKNGFVVDDDDEGSELDDDELDRAAERLKKVKREGAARYRDEGGSRSGSHGVDHDDDDDDAVVRKKRKIVLDDEDDE
ncbi:hypothetical protein PMKS-001065 [Pichia membranifaciens]|uniref:Uncharacterized protein n=1 Tax=Pichia membranifaciens TaxID=4926 RepID=A0A1Q2YDG7_9ASCO|nr:hypothetical protein PMKS-001065 [Pichia membranifaciens]